MDLAREALDQHEIRNVIGKLARYADMGDLEDYVALFDEDAAWNMPGGPRRGRADIRAGAEERRAQGVTGPGTNTRHHVTSISVDVVGDEASAESYFFFLSQTDKTPQLGLTGHYYDEFRRTPDGWKLSKRDITFG